MQGPGKLACLRFALTSLLLCANVIHKVKSLKVHMSACWRVDSHRAGLGRLLKETKEANMGEKCLRLWAQGRGRNIFLRADEGAVAFEFALVTPLLVTMLLGIFWVGRGYNVYETITRAAREGARYAVLPSSMHDGNTLPDALSNTCISSPTSSNVFNDYIAPALSASSLDPTQVQNFCQKTDWLGDTGDDPHHCGVEISFTYPVQVVVPFTSVNFSTINIQTQVQMRLENQPVVTSGTPTCP